MKESKTASSLFGNEICGELALQLSEALPESFDFYHIGRVDLATQADPTDLAFHALPIALAYTFAGDARGAVITLFDGELEESACEELGNIIACRWASRQEQGVDLEVAPPRRIERAIIEKMIHASSVAARGDYVLRFKDGRISRVCTLILAGAAPVSIELRSKSETPATHV